MPMIILGAAGSALMAGFTSGFALAAIGQAFIGNLILGGLSYALTPKPKKPSSVNQITTNTYTIRQSDSTRKHVYGMTRFTDIFGQIVSTGDNGKLHAIVIIADDEAQSLDEIWVNDYPICNDHLDADGTVNTGRYKNKLRIRKHLGSPSQVADSVAVAEMTGWTIDHRLQGICYLYVTLTKDQDIYPNGMPNFSVIGKFRKLLDPRTGVTRWTPNMALFAYDYLRFADFGYQAEDEDVDVVNISAQANICDEIVTTKDLDMDVDSVAAGTDIITLKGDRLAFEICDRVRLITSGTPPGGLATGTDYYVIPYQIKGVPKDDGSVSTVRIKLATSLDHAIDGIAIDITSGGTGTFKIRKTGEPRYHGAGVVDTADTLEDNFNQMLASMAGRAVITGGAWRLLAGAYQTPTLELTVSDFIGDMTTRGKIPMSDRFNTVSGVHVSQINDYQKADYPAYRNQAFIDQDRKEYPRDMPLAFTPRPTTCKRIAKRETLLARQELVHTVSCSLKALLAQVGDNIMLTIPRRGWEEKPFELTNLVFSVAGTPPNLELVTNITVRETAASIDDWAASEDDPDFDLAPNTTLPNPFIVSVPTGVAFSSRAVSTADADTLYNLVLSWNPHPDAFVVQFGHFEIQFKLSADTNWRPSFLVPGSLTFTDVLVSSVNVHYDLRIRAINNIGVRSNWVTIEDAVVGSSGGVGTTNNWQGVTDTIGTFLDWGAVTDAVGTTDDWGSVV